jgi:DHA2 family multidrug resistance protein
MILLPGGVATILCMPFRGKYAEERRTRAIPVRRRIYPVLHLLLDAVWFHPAVRYRGLFLAADHPRVGMAILFVPLTTLAISDLKGPEIGQGTGLNNMMRQLGGSFGIAIMTTVIHIKTNVNRNILLENYNQYNPAFNDRANTMTNNFVAQGASPEPGPADGQWGARRDRDQQTMLVTYNGMYLLIGVFT